MPISMSVTDLRLPRNAISAARKLDAITQGVLQLSLRRLPQTPKPPGNPDKPKVSNNGMHIPPDSADYLENYL